MYGRKLDPQPLGAGTSVRELVDGHFFAYNAVGLREACHLLSKRVLTTDATGGVTRSGVRTPTIAPVTSGLLSVQAIAASPSLAP